MLRSPLRWVGGKSRLREKILALFPKHECYCELFGGAAWVLMGKPPETSRCEVYNDRDRELVNFWLVAKHRAAELAEECQWLLSSRELFEKWKPMPIRIGTEVERAARFYAVIRLAYGAKRTQNHYGMRPEKRPPFSWALERESVMEVMRRLRVVHIENLPWQECIENYDRESTFFYVDPPYRCGASVAYRHHFSDDDHAKLAEVLRGSVKGQWLLSYNDDSFIRKLYSARGITIRKVGLQYSIQGGGNRAASELLISNF